LVRKDIAEGVDPVRCQAQGVELGQFLREGRVPEGKNAKGSAFTPLREGHVEGFQGFREVFLQEKGGRAPLHAGALPRHRKV
jgi:hypothetical protein